MKLGFQLVTSDEITTVVEMMQDFFAIDAYPFEKKATTSNLIEFVDNQQLGRLWLITLQTETIGYVVMTFGFSFEYGGRDAFIDEFFLREAYRNQGIGKKVLTFLEEQAISLKINTLHLEVERHNVKANALYRKMGYSDNDRFLLNKKIRFHQK